MQTIEWKPFGSKIKRNGVVMEEIKIKPVDIRVPPIECLMDFDKFDLIPEFIEKIAKDYDVIKIKEILGFAYWLCSCNIEEFKLKWEIFKAMHQEDKDIPKELSEFVQKVQSSMVGKSLFVIDYLKMAENLKVQMNTMSKSIWTYAMFMSVK